MLKKFSAVTLTVFSFNIIFLIYYFLTLKTFNHITGTLIALSLYLFLIGYIYVIPNAVFIDWLKKRHEFGIKIEWILYIFSGVVYYSLSYILMANKVKDLTTPLIAICLYIVMVFGYQKIEKFKKTLTFLGIICFMAIIIYMYI
jgi:hypothetical protein